MVRLLTLLCVLWAVPVSAQTTHTLTDCSEAEFESAISAASSGDTIQFPACAEGESGAFGTGNTSISKSLTIKGTYTSGAITSSSVANPTVITTSAAHGLTTGDDVVIVAHTGSVCSGNAEPCVWGEAEVTVTSDTTFTIDRNVTTGGTGGIWIKHETVISASDDGLLWQFTAADVRIVGFKFIRGNITAATGAEDYRIDRNWFDLSTDASTWDTAVFVYSQTAATFPKGVIDHNFFLNARVFMNGYVVGNSPEGLKGWSPTASACGFGTANAAFIEDNVFRFTVSNTSANAYDTGFAACGVVRNNIANSEMCHVHGLQSFQRGNRILECYDNYVIANNDIMTPDTPFWCRGGSCLFFGNTVVNNWGIKNISVDNQRSFDNRHTRCAGSTSYDGNSEGNGYPCLDQPGRGVDTTEWLVQKSATTGVASSPSTVTATGHGFPDGDYVNIGTGCGITTGLYQITVVNANSFTVAADSTGGSCTVSYATNTGQALDPLYEWDNVNESGGDLDFLVRNGLNTTVSAATSSTVFSLTSVSGVVVGQALIVIVDTDEESTVITGLTGSEVTVSPALSGTPDVGDAVITGARMHIRADRDYYNDTERPDYTAYEYPHPLNVSDDVGGDPDPAPSSGAGSRLRLRIRG